MCGRGGMADAQDSDSCPDYGGVGSSPIDRIKLSLVFSLIQGILIYIVANPNITNLINFLVSSNIVYITFLSIEDTVKKSLHWAI